MTEEVQASEDFPQREISMWLPKWFRTWRSVKQVTQQATEYMMPKCDKLKRGQRVGVVISVNGGLLMMHKDMYKLQTLRPNGDMVLKRIKEV